MMDVLDCLILLVSYVLFGVWSLVDGADGTS